MIQTTEQEQQHLAATSQQVAAKLQIFYDGLSAEEQQVLNRAVSELVAEAAQDDASGHANAIVVRVIAKGIIFVIDRLARANWSNAIDQAPPRDNVGNKI